MYSAKLLGPMDPFNPLQHGLKVVPTRIRWPVANVPNLVGSYELQDR